MERIRAASLHSSYECIQHSLVISDALAHGVIHFANAAKNSSTTGDLLMAHKQVKIRNGGGLPSIELRFGNALFAKYDVFLYDQKGTNPQPVTTAQLNSDDEPDIFRVGTSVDLLDQQILFWQAAISVLDNQPGQTYLMRAIITQGGTELATFDKRGPITNTVIDQDTVRFVLE